MIEKIETFNSVNKVKIMSKYIYRKTFDWIMALIKESLANGESYQSRAYLWNWFDRNAKILYG